jgi:hypothetical protein
VLCVFADADDGVASTRSTPTVQVVCRDCGDSCELTRGTVAEQRRRGLPDLCRSCRHPGSGPGLSAIEASKAWWLARYPLAELRRWPPL